MGYSFRLESSGEKITTYWPDDGEKYFYIWGYYSPLQIIEVCKKKFGENIDMNRVLVRAAMIRTDNINSVDSVEDYTEFIVIEYNP